MCGTSAHWPRCGQWNDPPFVIDMVLPVGPVFTGWRATGLRPCPPSCLCGAGAGEGIRLAIRACGRLHPWRHLQYEHDQQVVLYQIDDAPVPCAHPIHAVKTFHGDDAGVTRFFRRALIACWIRRRRSAGSLRMVRSTSS